MQTDAAFSQLTFITRQEHLLLERISREIRKIPGRTSRAIYGCHLSLFVPPKDEILQTAEERDAVYRSVLLAAVVRKVKDSPLVLALVSDGSPYAAVTQRILERAGFTSRIVDVNAIDKADIEDLCSCLDQAFKSTDLSRRRVTNKSEHRTFRLTQSALELAFSLPHTLRSDNFALAFVHERKKHATAILLPPVRISGVGVQMEKELVESFMREEALRVALGKMEYQTGT